MFCFSKTVISASILQSLRLCCIGITTVNDDAFQGLDSLWVLMLHANKLTAGPSLQHIRQLRSLHLHNNLITKLSINYFAGCYKLKGLNLKNNHLVSLSDMSYVSHILQHVTLDGNRLANLDAFECVPWPQLQRLTLAHNLISVLNQSLLENAKALELIDLTYNALRTLPDLTQIKRSQNTSRMLTIRVEGNLWHCNGSLHWVLDGTIDRMHIKFDAGFQMDDGTYMPCHTPPKLKSTPLWDLGKFSQPRNKTKFTCFE